MIMSNYYSSGNDSVTMMLSNIQVGVVLSCQTISLLGIANLLLFVPLKSRLCGWPNPSAHMSSMMRLFLAAHAVLLLTGYAVYLQKATEFFNPNTHFYVVLWIYDIGAPYNYIQSFLNFMLTLERILVIRFPLLHTTKRYHSHYLCAVALSIPLVYMSLLIWYILEMPLDQSKALCCAPFIKNSPKFNYEPQTYLKLFYGIIDLGCGILFIFWLNKNMGKKIKNRVIKFTIFGEIIFEIVPGFLYQIGNNYLKIIPPTASLFAGNIKDTMVYMSLSLCVIYYNWIFLIVAPRTRENHNSSTRVLAIQQQQQQPTKTINLNENNGRLPWNQPSSRGGGPQPSFQH